MPDKETLQQYQEQTLPANFFPEVQKKYDHGDSLVLTDHGVDFLARNPNFFTLLNGALQRIDVSIENAVGAQVGMVRKSFEDLLKDHTAPETVVNDETKESVTISFLGKGSQSWALLLQVGGEDEKYVIKLPCTKGAYFKLDSPLALLRKGNQNIPDFPREMMSSVNIENHFADELKAENLHMPDYLMAGGFFNIARYEGETEIPEMAYRHKMVPLATKLATEISYLGEVEDRPEWRGVFPDWSIAKHDSFRMRPDGSYVCIDPVSIA